MYSGPLRTGSRMIAKKIYLTLQHNIFFSVHAMNLDQTL